MTVSGPSVPTAALLAISKIRQAPCADSCGAKATHVAEVAEFGEDEKSAMDVSGVD